MRENEYLRARLDQLEQTQATTITGEGERLSGRRLSILPDRRGIIVAQPPPVPVAAGLLNSQENASNIPHFVYPPQTTMRETGLHDTLDSQPSPRSLHDFAPSSSHLNSVLAQQRLMSKDQQQPSDGQPLESSLNVQHDFSHENNTLSDDLNRCESNHDELCLRRRSLKTMDIRQRESSVSGPPPSCDSSGSSPSSSSVATVLSGAGEGAGVMSSYPSIECKSSLSARFYDE